jgi:hypothetical protein
MTDWPIRQSHTYNFGRELSCYTPFFLFKKNPVSLLIQPGAKLLYFHVE